MKIRMIALAGVAVLALGGQAAASDAHGWYLGLGAGWDHMGNVEAKFTPIGGGAGGTQFKVNTDDSALIVGSFGYRFENRIRLEAEIGYAPHDVNAAGFSGHADIVSWMVNVGL